jgi:pimeloyl-ACP methyl ester carboxylesterase
MSNRSDARPAAATAGPAAPSSGWTRTTSFDGTGLAWRVDMPAGGPAAGHLPAVLCNGIACSDQYWPDVVAGLARRRAVVRWDYRSHGRSDPPADPAEVTVDSVVRDLVAVLDAAGVGRAVVVGHSFGVQVALEAARVVPERVAAVVAVAGAPGQPMGRLLGINAGTLLFPPLALLQRLTPGTSRQAWRRLWASAAMPILARALRGTTTSAPAEVMAAYFSHVGRLDLEVLLGMMRSMQLHSAEDALESLDIPLLAIAGDADGLTPPEVMAAMAMRARGEFAVLEGAAHTLPAEQPGGVLAVLEPFLDRIDERRRQGRRS